MNQKLSLSVAGSHPAACIQLDQIAKPANFRLNKKKLVELTSHTYIYNKLTKFLGEKSTKLLDTEFMRICRNCFGKNS